MTKINACILPKKWECVHGKKLWTLESPVLAVPLCPVQCLVGSQCLLCWHHWERSQGKPWQWQQTLVVQYAARVLVFLVSFGQLLRQNVRREQTITRHSQRMFSVALYLLQKLSLLFQIADHCSVLHTTHLNLFLGLSIVPSSPCLLNLIFLYCSCDLLSTVVLPQSPWWWW